MQKDINMMKINLSSIVLSCLFWSASHAAPLVVISQVVNHPALDRTVQGIVDGLSDYARENKTALEVRIESAQNSTSLAAQIAAKAVSQNASCSVGVGTLSAQSFSKYARKGQTKLIFSSVTDPMNAQLINSYQEPGFNTSGVSNFIDVDPQLDLFLKVQPHLKKLGFIYNTGEANSVSLEKVIDMACQKRGIQLVSQVATRSQDIAQITQKLAQEVDAIFISNDSTALSALSVIIQQASAMHVPVYVSDIDS
ncbi:MAG: ABC transporter substrate-binding protein, partial [Gammaproteobacteria bacterium]|nr:ABC transporter substrate-binding protein [Gammaproteobacteria bacterium]